MTTIAPTDFSPLAELTPTEVHLWLLDLAPLTQNQLDTQRSLLSNDELTRALLFKRGADDFVATRILLRRALSYYSKIPPQQIRFELSKEGKPALVQSGLAQPLAFNLSHSGSKALLAVGRQRLLGVDIEAGARQRQLNSLAQRFYHPAEAAWLAELPEHQQHQAFYRLWTLKEAFFKALGTGISAGLHRAHFTLRDNDQTQVALAPELDQNPYDWQFYQTSLADDYTCALAATNSTPIAPRWLDANQLLFTGE
jgi:4'-phosphopantetheinyl transferase